MSNEPDNVINEFGVPDWGLIPVIVGVWLDDGMKSARFGLIYW